MRLSSGTCGGLPAIVDRPDYDRTARGRGIVHFGLGAFTRAHQAAYTDAAMSEDEGDWLITGVSMRSQAVAEQMNPQNGLYLIAEQSAAGTRYRLGGAISDVLAAPGEPQAVIAAIADPGTRIVSFTVTEKGYCRADDGSLDIDHAGKGSFYPLLAEGLRRRRASGAGGLTLLSCDNLAANGSVLERMMREFLAAKQPDLCDWFETECSCPSTMVDRIVPATTDADRAAAEAATGLRDEALVVTEPFSQWVIEDRFANGRPAWEAVGAELVGDVAPYETAKLRMLNGAHSLLAYCGLEAGHEFVHQAIADPALRALVETLMQEASATIKAAPGQDLAGYAALLVERFANPALNHRLAQIAMDGSQKIPQRWLETLFAHQQKARQCPAILRGVAAWIRHLRGQNGPVDDPMADRLAAAAGAADPVAKLFGQGGLIASKWEPSPDDVAVISLQFA
ncbi:MAG: mannitol dehydrogenase family protein [Pontixanthobacter sp.]